ncbi:unnamed protein product, partial [Phaeothamnion confervicola]
VTVRSRTNLESLFEELDGKVRVAPLEMGFSQVDLESRIARLEINGVLEFLDGQIELAFEFVEQAQLEASLAQIGVFREKLAEGFEGIFRIAHARQANRALEAHFEAVGVQAQSVGRLLQSELELVLK